MAALRHLLGRHRPALIALVALLLAVRALVPQGFMPVPGGGLALMPCPAASAVRMPAVHGAHSDHGGHHAGHDAGGQDGRGSDCGFAPAGLLALAGDDAIVVATARLAERPGGMPVTAFAAPASAPFLRPPARGPPAYA